MSYIFRRRVLCYLHDTLWSSTEEGIISELRVQQPLILSKKYLFFVFVFWEKRRISEVIFVDCKVSFRKKWNSNGYHKNKMNTTKRNGKGLETYIKKEEFIDWFNFVFNLYKSKTSEERGWTVTVEDCLLSLLSFSLLNSCTFT